jgi:hypothetical protein
MKLTKNEIKGIAYQLDEVISSNFHNTVYNTVWEREMHSDEDIEVDDEDILAIKQELKRIL